MPIAAALPFIIGGAGAGLGLLGSDIQSNAARNAANAQSQAAQLGINTVNQGEQGALGLQGNYGNLISSLLGPYQQLGGQGRNLLSQLLGTPTANTTGALAPTSLTESWATPFNAPTANQVRATPGYNFMQDAGQQAIQNSAAAQGNLLSGSTLKGLESYGTGLADTYYQQAFQNAMQQYMNNYNIFQGNQGNLYNRLMGVSGQGLGASALGANAGLGLAGFGTNTYMGGANTIAQLLAQQGAARASGYVGSANAWANGIGGLGNNLMGLGAFNYLGGLGQQNPGQQTPTDYNNPWAYPGGG